MRLPLGQLGPPAVFPFSEHTDLGCKAAALRIHRLQNYEFVKQRVQPVIVCQFGFPPLNLPAQFVALGYAVGVDGLPLRGQQFAEQLGQPVVKVIVGRGNIGGGHFGLRLRSVSRNVWRRESGQMRQ